MNGPIIAGGLAALWLLTRGRDGAAAPVPGVDVPQDDPGSVLISSVCRGDDTDCIDGEGNPLPSPAVAKTAERRQIVSATMTGPEAARVAQVAGGGTLAGPAPVAGGKAGEVVTGQGQIATVAHDGHGMVTIPTTTAPPPVATRADYTQPDCPDCAERKAAERTVAAVATVEAVKVPATPTASYWPAVTSRQRSAEILKSGPLLGGLW